MTFEPSIPVVVTVIIPTPINVTATIVTFDFTLTVATVLVTSATRVRTSVGNSGLATLDLAFFVILLKKYLSNR